MSKTEFNRSVYERGYTSSALYRMRKKNRLENAARLQARENDPNHKTSDQIHAEHAANYGGFSRMDEKEIMDCEAGRLIDAYVALKFSALSTSKCLARLSCDTINHFTDVRIWEVRNWLGQKIYLKITHLADGLIVKRLKELPLQPELFNPQTISK
jgi:hypothetical protein